MQTSTTTAPLCPICHQPAHAAESDDLDRHPECAAIEDELAGPLAYLIDANTDDGDVRYAIGWITAKLDRDGATFDRRQVSATIRARMTPAR